MSNQERAEYLVVHEGGIVGTALYPSDARTRACEFVRANPGARVRIYRGGETIYSYVAVDSDLPKEAPPAAQEESP